MLLLKKLIFQKKKFNFYLKLYFISVFGALIHYYCIFFTIYICFIVLILLLVQRKWVTIIKLIITGILGGFTSILLFPAMKKLIFYGYRGKGFFF